MTDASTTDSNTAAITELWSRALGVVRNTRLSKRTRLLAARSATTLSPRAPATPVALARLVETMLGSLDAPAVIAELGRSMRRNRPAAEPMNAALFVVAQRAAAQDLDSALAELTLLLLQAPRPHVAVPHEWVARSVRAWIRDDSVPKIAGLIEVYLARSVDDLPPIDGLVSEHPRLVTLLEQSAQTLVQLAIRCPTPEAWRSLARAKANDVLPLRVDRIRAAIGERLPAACAGLAEALRRETDERRCVVLAGWLVELRG